jgi:hypothetical protein
VYFDAKTKGLALRVSPRGARTWAFVYRSGGRPPQWMTLGTYPALGLAEARARALNKRHAIDVEKRDPAAEERAARAAAAALAVPGAVAESASATFTFADLVRLYEAFAKGRKKTWRDDLAMTRRHLLPVWGPMPLRAITRALSAIHGGAYTWKDLRRTVSTRLAARGFSEEVIWRALNHARYTVTAPHYIKHGYEAEVRHALETWDADLADIVAGREASRAAVVPFRR